MAQPTPLQPGQINPQAQPVSTFIEPAKKQIANAAQPQQMPTAPQLQAIQTGGTTFVQGKSSFAQLAEDLQQYSPTIMKSATTAGLKYVDWRMETGEQQAMQEVQRGLAQLDEQAEVAGNDRAAANRAIQVKDPGAGWLMRTLDPYQQMGYQRGKVKMAGQAVALGLPSFVQKYGSEIDPTTGRPFIDYEAPDMGMSGLQKLQARYQLGIENQYGIDSGSPGYGKYFAPRLLRAQETLAQNVMDDRTKFFESQIGPQAITGVLDELNLLGDDRKPIRADNGVEIPYFVQDSDGKTIVNNNWLRARATQLSMRYKELVARAPLGMTAKISKDLYMQVAKQFPEGSIQRRVLNMIQGPDGKSFAARYGYLDRELNAEYVATENKTQKAEREITKRGYEDELRVRLGAGIPFEQAQNDAIDMMNGARQRQGLPPLSAQEEARLRAGATRSIQELDPQRPIPGGGITPTDPQAPQQLLNQLSSQSIYDIDVTSARQQLAAMTQAGIAAGQEGALTGIRSRLDSAEKAQKDENSWVGKYNTDMDGRIQGLVGDGGSIFLQPQDEQAATDKLSVEMRKRMTAALKGLGSSQDGPVTQEQIDDTVVKVWQGLQKEVQDGSFGIPGYLNEPSTYDKGPKPKPPTTTGQKPSAAAPLAAVDLNQLDNFPKRNNRLRNWRNEKTAILSANALITIIQDAAAGRPENPKFTKAWRQSGAPNAWSFIERQLRYYENGNLGKDGRGWTQDQFNKAKQELLSYVIRNGNIATTMSLEKISPKLASYSNWAMDLV